MRKNVGTLLILASCMALVPTAAGGGAPAPLLIAVEGPQSGEQATNGLDQLRGVRLAVRQLNAQGGLWDGRKVTVFPVDDKGDAANARRVAQRVVARRIRFLIGPYNSSVGIANLAYYRRNGVLPLWMTSRDETAGAGATVQPMNTQIAPVERAYVRRIGARRIAMLVDDTANGAFTRGMANRLRTALRRDGATVTWTSVRESTAQGLPGTYYADRVAEALAAAGSAPPCLMGLANVDNGFVARTTVAQARRCVFSGVPAATEMPSARTYVRQYRSAFGRTPGVWGSFTYDSAKILFAALNRARSYEFGAVQRELRRTKGYRGATSLITIHSRTGYRTSVPVSILRVDSRKRFVIAR